MSPAPCPEHSKYSGHNHLCQFLPGRSPIKNHDQIADVPATEVVLPNGCWEIPSVTSADRHSDVSCIHAYAQSPHVSQIDHRSAGAGGDGPGEYRVRGHACVGVSPAAGGE